MGKVAMYYPLLHKGSPVTIGLCFQISSATIPEGEYGFFYVNSDGVADPSTAKLVRTVGAAHNRKRSETS